MSRLRRIEQSYRYFFVTTNLAKSVLPFSASERTMVLNDLRAIRSTHDFLLLAYVVMPDHVHLLIYPRETTLTAVLRDFKVRSTASLHKSRHCCGPVWQSRFFDFICRRVRDFWSKVDYIHQNPVAAELVISAQEWAWSSAASLDSVGNLVALKPDRVEMPVGGDTLLWPAWDR